MSFSSDVKNEITKHMASARHCQLAEMASYVIWLATLNNEGELVFEGDELQISHIDVLAKKLYTFSGKERLSENGRHILLYDKDASKEILMSVKRENENEGLISHMLIKNSCCKKAYLQGMFICIGSVTDPEKEYHLEMVSYDEKVLLQLKEILESFDILARITIRKKAYVLYIKEGQSIVDLLNIMGAHVCLMNMENSIIMKDFRNNLNRKVNCETANILKTANTGSRQKADIEYIRDNYGIEKLPVQLREIALLRLEYPDISLKELGEMMTPPLGKSGVNHRLRKISEIRKKCEEI